MNKNTETNHYNSRTVECDNCGHLGRGLPELCDCCGGRQVKAGREESREWKAAREENRR